MTRAAIIATTTTDGLMKIDAPALLGRLAGYQDILLDIGAGTNEIRRMLIGRELFEESV